MHIYLLFSHVSDKVTYINIVDNNNKDLDAKLEINLQNKLYLLFH